MTDTPTAPRAVLSTEVVIPCAELGPMVRFFTERLGFELVMIMPADDPAVAVVAGGGGRVRLVRDGDGDPGHLRLRTNCGVGGGETLIAPNGTRIDLVEADPPLVLPPLAPELEISRFADSGWGTGRAGMLYRDLLPGRQGGRFIASHIRIPDAGPVPDSVHHHRIRFQLIHCVAGWVRLVYEDQGPPFVLEAGDCVLQPPGIRHRVLEASEGLEVVEIGCPAEHETFLDHHTELPSPTADAARRFGGQGFVRHRATDASWRPWRDAGFESRDTGIGAATDGLGGARIVRARTGGSSHRELAVHDGELLFWFVVAGAARLALDGRPDVHLMTGDAIAVPAGLGHAVHASSYDLELLEVTLPDRLKLSPCSPPSPRRR